MSSRAAVTQPHPLRPRGRPRCEDTCALIRRTAQALLEEGSFDTFSIEAVAARAGVAKTTIYRWWKSKAELAVDAFLEAVAAEVPFPPGETDPVREQFRKALRRTCRLYRGPVGRFMRSVAAAALADEQVRSLWWERFFAVRRAAIAARLAESAERGEIRRDHDPEVVLDALFGPVVYNLFLTGRPPTDGRMDRIVDMVFDGLEPGRSRR